MTENWQQVCEQCGAIEELGTRTWRCATCGGALQFTNQLTLDVASIDAADPSLFRYTAWLPPRPVGAPAPTLGAGMTPLIPGRLAGRDVWLKLDSLLPSGSFKDRGAALVCAYYRAMGIERLIVDSSGNAAAAMAAFSAANGMHCHVFAPATTSPGKLVQARAYGAALTTVTGSREDVADAAQQAAAADPGNLYASHNWSPVFAEGVKTWALEVWEQLQQRIPTHAFIPTGGGSALIGARRGFGLLPGGNGVALIAAQPAACAPLVAAFDAGASEVTPVVPGVTRAEGTRIAAPARSRQLLEAVQGSGGWATGVSEDEIVAAARELWSQGVYVEPTAAVGAAAFTRAVADGRVPDTAVPVVLITGNGLKATGTIDEVLSA